MGIKLNLGCGTNKIEGFINVDIDRDVSPDEIFDFTGKFPYADNSVDEVVAFHVIEHIPKRNHDLIFSEIYRVLVPHGKLILSFPEFPVCVEYWKTNKKGMKEFWEATIYGRQASPFDFHVCITARDDIAVELVRKGFAILYNGPEKYEEFNSVIKAEKVGKFTYQDAMKETLYGSV